MWNSYKYIWHKASTKNTSVHNFHLINIKPKSSNILPWKDILIV